MKALAAIVRSHVLKAGVARCFIAQWQDALVGLWWLLLQRRNGQTRQKQGKGRRNRLDGYADT